MIYDRNDQVAQSLAKFRNKVDQYIRVDIIAMLVEFDSFVELSHFDSQKMVDQMEESIFEVYQKHLKV
jgi:hypothetical protein